MGKISFAAMGIVRQMAGFDASNHLNYYLARDVLQPPEELRQKIFPELDHYVLKLREDGADRSVSADGFIATLQFLRTVLLQDAPSLREHYPNLPIWDHPLFLDPLYIDFADRQAAAMAAAEAMDPAEVRLRAVLPDLCTRFDGQIQAVQASIERLRDDSRPAVNIADQLLRIEQMLGSLINGQLQVHVSAAFHPPGELLESILFRRLSIKSVIAGGAPTSTSESSLIDPVLLAAPNTNVRSALEPPFPSSSDVAPSSQSTVPPVGRPPVAIHAARPPTSKSMAAAAAQYGEPPFSGLLPTIAQDIPTLWREWMIGLPGRLPIVEMDRRYGEKRWIREASEKKRYQRRARVIEEVLASPMYCGGQSPQAALQDVEGRRGSSTLHAFGEKLFHSDRQLRKSVQTSVT